jgi:Domain of unknown function (DUF4145)
MAEEEKTKWVLCASCGQRQRRHRVLYEKSVLIGSEEDQPPEQEEHHRLVECMGCETIKYVISTSDWPADDSRWGDTESEFKIYPDVPGANLQRLPGISQDEATYDDGKLLIPVSVWKMYKETIEALDANIRTLAGGGLRATVEAICLDNNIREGNLQTKIDQLTKQNLLTAAQAELLHEERYLGNAALHEMETPTVQDIEDGLRIVEGLINTIYVLPSKAQRLRERRNVKKALQISK